MKFVTFYQPSAIDNSRLIEACGDRAVIITDGRLSSDKQHKIAREECIKRGYLAYQRHIGESLTRVQWSGAVIRVNMDNPTVNKDITS